MKLEQKKFMLELCPEIKFPDFYGIDMPSKKELLAANKNLKKCVSLLVQTL